MALGYQNPFYLKQAQQKQQSLYNVKVLLEKHDPPVVYDSDETLELAQEKADESLAKNKALELEIEHLLRVAVSQDIMSIVQTPSIVSKQEDTTKGMSTNTKFANQSTERKPSLQPLRNNFVVRQPNAFQSERTKSSINRVPQKVDETNDLSKPVTSNSAPSSKESTVVNHERVIAPGIFGINPFKASRYVNGIKSRKKKQNANVSKSANQNKHKPRVWKPKMVRSKERLASPKPSTPRSCLRWSPTGRMFDLKGNIIATSESECQSDCFKGGQNWFDTLLIPLLSEYKPKDREDHGDNECDS
ncbi:hypothetical protein Tco_0498896 [Tanacetum coccineum]